MPSYARIIATLFAFACCITTGLAKKPLKIYILAGQSNMVGTGSVETFPYIGDDPATAPLLKKMMGANGKPKVCERVWISSLNGKMNDVGGVGSGKLTAGYGVRRQDPTKPDGFIGPEFTFGITMEEAYDGPILIIKTAWGGQSLSVDYRSPGSGPYKLNDWQTENFTKKGSLEKISKLKKENTGRRYHAMVKHVQAVLSDIKSVYPDYDAKQGYELAGFVWFQGWNDYADTGTYRIEQGEKQYADYGTLLEQFIRDVRKDLKTPELPFVIGVMGTFGDYKAGTFNPGGASEARMKRFREAMAAPTKVPEFKGNVTAVQTAPFREDALGFIDMKMLKHKQMRYALQKKSKNGPNADGKMTPAEQKEFLLKYRAELISEKEEALWKRATSIGGFVHYYGSAKFHAQAGKAFAEAMQELEK